MRALALAAIALALGPTLAQAQTDFQQQQDQKIRDYFKGLSIPGLIPNCCSDADCKRTRADYHDGQWWAESAKLRDDEKNPHPGEWVPIPPDRVTPNQSPYDNEAVICEGISETPNSTDHPTVTIETVPGAFKVILFCFSPPPIGF